MPRTARVKCSEALYHISERGNERRAIFNDDTDRIRFLDIVRRNQTKYGFGIYAYCLMTNHLHLLVASHGADISQVMKSINISYVIYFNRKYQRCGHLFQDRFRSELVDSNEYIMEVSRYIHLNPLRAGMVSNETIHEYPWSSYPHYVHTGVSGYLPVETDFILGLFSDDLLIQRKKYRDYVMQDESTGGYAGAGGYGVADKTAQPRDDASRKSASAVTAPESVEAIAAQYAEAGKAAKLSRDEIRQRNQLIREIRKQTQMTLKEIGLLFGGLSESLVGKIVKGD